MGDGSWTPASVPSATKTAVLLYGPVPENEAKDDKHQYNVYSELKYKQAVKESHTCFLYDWR